MSPDEIYHMRDTGEIPIDCPLSPVPGSEMMVEENPYQRVTDEFAISHRMNILMQ